MHTEAEATVELGGDERDVLVRAYVERCRLYGGSWGCRIDGDVQAFVSARFKGSDLDEWPCRGTVVLHRPAHEVRPFVDDGVLVALDDHRCSIETGSWSWGALAAWFGRFESAMDVVGPPELVSAFALLAERYDRAGGASAHP